MRDGREFKLGLEFIGVEGIVQRAEWTFLERNSLHSQKRNSTSKKQIVEWICTVKSRTLTKKSYLLRKGGTNQHKTHNEHLLWRNRTRVQMNWAGKGNLRTIGSSVDMERRRWGLLQLPSLTNYSDVECYHYPWANWKEIDKRGA